MQQGARDLDPAQLAARQLAHLVARALGQLEAGEFGLGAALRLAMRNSCRPAAYRGSA